MESSKFETNKEIEIMDNGKRSWVIASACDSSFYLPEALHIERNDELMLVENDEEASIEAEKDGVPLIYGVDGIPDGVYIDTEENRRIIFKMLERFPELRW